MTAAGASGRIVVAITGASSPILGIRALQALGETGVETHLVVSRGARRTIRLESDWSVGDVYALAHHVHDPRDLAAPIASGSFLTDGMLVAPCSMKAVAAIAHSFATDLVARAADVTLKERRPLVLAPRESPLHLGHLRNMALAAEIGATIAPPVLGHYFQPASVDELVDHIVGRLLDQLRVGHVLGRRWNGPPARTDAGAAAAAVVGVRPKRQ